MSYKPKGCLQCAHFYLFSDRVKKCGISETLTSVILIGDLSPQHTEEIIAAGEHCELFKARERNVTDYINGNNAKEILAKLYRNYIREDIVFTNNKEGQHGSTND